jgi:DNA-binding NarL/FixJ family response regulator
MKTILSASDEIEVVAEADNGAMGLELFRGMRPDVTLLSLRLPDSCAVDTLKDFLIDAPKSKIIILAANAGDAEISRSLERGASGFVFKDVSADELLKAIHTVSAGKRFIPANIASVLSDNFGSENLTPSEQKILEMIVEGQANKEIAYNLDISENTVKTHVKNILAKLGVDDRTSAATSAIKRGLVRVDRLKIDRR